MGPRELLAEHRRLLVTGYRHCANGRLMAEERVGRAPFRVVVEELMSEIVCRRNCETRDGHILSTEEMYKKVRAQLCETARITRQREMKWEERLRILHPGWKPKEGEGPMAEWTKEWVASGSKQTPSVETFYSLSPLTPARCRVLIRTHHAIISDKYRFRTRPPTDLAQTKQKPPVVRWWRGRLCVLLQPSQSVIATRLPL